MAGGDAQRDLLAAAAGAPLRSGSRFYRDHVPTHDSEIVRRYRAAGLIGPQPVRLGATLRWNRLEVEAWLLRRTAKGEMLDARTWSGMWKGGRG